MVFFIRFAGLVELGVMDYKYQTGLAIATLGKELT